MAVPLWEKGETREPLKSFCSLSSIILRIPHGLCSQGAESKTNTAELNQDGDLTGNKTTIKITKRWHSEQWALTPPLKMKFPATYFHIKQIQKRKQPSKQCHGVKSLEMPSN